MYTSSTHRGCSYHVVHNGQQAVEEVTASMLNEGAVMYDVILMDCMMVREICVLF
jgi:CheY-like chemotaxis protein